jgi:aryl-phospho-beta-D-glucosidase BglC (GH1 family)
MKTHSLWGERDIKKFAGATLIVAGMMMSGCSGTIRHEDSQIAAATISCAAEFTVVNSWKGGYLARVTVHNPLEKPMTGWTMELTFLGDEKVSSGWGGAFVQEDHRLLVTPAEDTAMIGPGSTVEFGYVARGFAGPAKPDLKVLHPFCDGSVHQGDPSVPASDETPSSPNHPAQQEALGTPVALHGQLKVVGTQLMDQKGAPVQLKGMSSHGLQWFGGFMNYDSIKWLRDDWKASLVRAAMYTESGGYLENPAVERKTEEIVEAAIKLGMYVIIDWHILEDGNPNIHRNEAKAFFRRMAQKYGEYPNVLYEIANEPNGKGVSWNAVLKDYATDLVQTIRDIDPDNVIIVGTANWDQMIVDAANDPLQAENIVYTLHFYCGGHDGVWLRSQVEEAMAKGIAIFVSEWGASHFNGNDGIYLDSAREWMSFLDRHKISWANWSLSDKNESSAALMPGASERGGWSVKQLTESGRFVRDAMRKP